MKSNVIYTADNLDVLRGMDDESVDLIYLDPPFNKNKTFTGKTPDLAFKDAWEMGPEEEAWLSDIYDLNSSLYDVAVASGSAGGTSYTAYSVYMAVRLLEMHRILKPTGSIYYHCDPTMSHSIKLLMDVIFGSGNFRNEIVWKRYRGKRAASNPKKYAAVIDYLLFYVKENGAYFDLPFTPLDSAYVKRTYRHNDDDGKGRYRYGGRIRDRKYYLSNSRGTPAVSLWDDIHELNGTAAEHQGYPTQKPLALLDRVIQASSNIDDLVLDPFCGCATTCVAAQGLSRKWIGIDISSKAADLVEKRMKDQFGLTLPGKFRAKKLPTRENNALRSLDIKIKRQRHTEQNGKCNGCNTKAEMRRMHIDHIIARSKGGPDIDSNIQLLCGPCNSSKGSGTMENLLQKNYRNREMKAVTKDFCDTVMAVIKQRRKETSPHLIPAVK